LLNVAAGGEETVSKKSNKKEVATEGCGP